MTATIVELRPGDLQREAIDRNLDPRVLASGWRAVEPIEDKDDAYRNSSPRLKCAAWMTYFILCILSWWAIAKLIVVAWNLIAP